MGLGGLLVAGAIAAAVFAGGGGEAGGGTVSADEALVIDNFEFMPSEFTVPAGTEFEVSNVDSADHTFTADDRESFDTDAIEQEGGEATVTIDEAGTYPYFCDFHPYMTGTVTVTE